MRNGKQNSIRGVRPSMTLATGGWRRTGLVCLVAAATMVSPAQNGQPSPDAVKFKSLVNFDGTNGINPYLSNLVQGPDGNLYGTTELGGAYGGGSVFKITPRGTLTTVYSFCAEPNCADGAYPQFGALALGTDGNFYWAAAGGGAFNNGTVFKITTAGALTTLCSFCALPNCTDGSIPIGLVQGTDGNFYGTTNFGGNATQNGVVFKVTPGGMLTTLYTFCSEPNCADGGTPTAPLIQATDGNFYGTTQALGANGGGTVFKITPKGELTTAYSFCAQPNCTDGWVPQAPVIQAANGNFYGTTEGGGLYGRGTVFELTPEGAFTMLYSFCAQTNCADGEFPGIGTLVQGTDGSFYGTTTIGGTSGLGTVFKITAPGTLTTLHDFDGTDGDNSVGNGLVQGTDGTFYGTNYGGGADDDGTVFGLSVGLGPFVETLPTSDKLGEVVKILGTDLSGATRVSFNGTAAPFKVDSETLISAIVPDGATTGFVTVTIPTGTLKSNTRFQVRP